MNISHHSQDAGVYLKCEGLGNITCYKARGETYTIRFVMEGVVTLPKDEAKAALLKMAEELVAASQNL